MQLFVDREVARTSRNLLVTNLALLAALLAGAALAGDYYRDFFGGPAPTTLEELARAGGRPARAWVKLQGELIETAYVERTYKEGQRPESGKVSAEYLALHDGTHTLLIKADGGTHGSEISGWLGDLERSDREVLQGLKKDEPDVADTWLPVVLDAQQDRSSGWIGLVAGALTLAIVLRNLRAWTVRRSRPEAHPIWKRLAALGQARSLAAQLDMETRGAVRTFKGGATLTPSYLLRKALYTLEIVPVERVAWVHKKVTTQKKLFITVGKTVQAIVHDRDGGETSFTAPDAEVDGLLGAIVERAPWVLAGWSEELEQAWKSRRAEVIAAVDARRQHPGAAAGGAEG